MIIRALPDRTDWDLVVVGGGPVGLAAAWAAASLNWDGIVLERGRVAEALRGYPDEMTFSSLAPMMEIGGLRPSADGCGQVTVPTAVEHFSHVAESLSWQVCEGACVKRIWPGHTGFYLEAGKKIFTARGVILATGQFDGPCRLGVSGEDLPHVRYYFDRGAYYRGRSVAVVGGSFSALETAYSLVSAGAHVTLIHRGHELGAANRVELRRLLYGWGEQGKLRLLLRTQVDHFFPGGLTVNTRGGKVEDLQADPVFVQIGYYADPALLLQTGITNTPEGMPEHDRTNGATAVPGLYIAGAATNGQIKGDRIGIKSGIPQAKLAVYHFSYLQGCAGQVGRAASTLPLTRL